MAAVPAAVPKPPEGVDLYARFALAGALGCSVTHGAFTPVDVYVAVSFPFLSFCLSLCFSSSSLTRVDLPIPAASRPGFSSTPRPTTVA